MVSAGGALHLPSYPDIPGAARFGSFSYPNAEVSVARYLARAQVEAGPGPGDGALALSRSELAEAWGIGE